MCKDVSIDNKHEVITFDELVLLIEQNSDVQLILRNVAIDASLLKQLQDEFPDMLVDYIQWSKILITRKSMKRETVLLNLDLFLDCFIAYDQLADKLMHLLAQTFGVNLENPDEIGALMRKNNNHRGQINPEWDYFFHANECAFVNKQTKQYIDVIVGNGLEFGVFNHFFLYRFIETTPVLAEQFAMLEGKAHNLRKVIGVLKRAEFLTDCSKGDFEELVLNREKVKPLLLQK